MVNVFVTFRRRRADSHLPLLAPAHIAGTTPRISPDERKHIIKVALLGERVRLAVLEPSAHPIQKVV